MSSKCTYPDCPVTSQLLVQPARKLPWCTRLIGICEGDGEKQPGDCRDECGHHDCALAWCRPCVLFWREDAQNVIVLVARLAKVALLLLVPPVGIGISELSLLKRRVDIATVLRVVSQWPGNCSARGTYHARVVDVDLRKAADLAIGDSRCLAGERASQGAR